MDGKSWVERITNNYSGFCVLTFVFSIASFLLTYTGIEYYGVTESNGMFELFLSYGYPTAFVIKMLITAGVLFFVWEMSNLFYVQNWLKLAGYSLFPLFWILVTLVNAYIIFF